MNESEDGVRRHLTAIADDRRVIAHERNLLDSWERGLNREERMARRALEAVDESGQVRLVNPLTGRAHVPSSNNDQRAAVMVAFRKVAPAHDRRVPQRELERHAGLSSGTLSRTVRDLEAQGVLFRVGMTAKRSALWSDVRPEGDPR